MKKKLGLLLILTLGFIIFSFVSVFLLNKEHAPELKILSSPRATVFLDNVNIGKTPIEGFVVIAGDHILRLDPDKVATETASWQGKISAFKNSRTYVDRQLGSGDISSSGVVFAVRPMDKKPEKGGSGEIEVQTDPTGAIVYLDNDEKGIASLVLENVPAGEHELSIYSPGFIRRSQKIKLTSGFRIIGEIKLAIDPSYQKVEAPPDVNEATPSATTITPGTSPTPTPQKITGKSVKILETPTGWLRVRESPSLGATEYAKVNSGDTFELLEEQSGWVKITYEKGKSGWVSAQYTEKL
ncbi:hypothetical protein A3D80_02055 [Candidatus Roizmanbacteria bacterium RIFCSPHIGHO2_02_FULL_40_13b]|uniref:SH3b domain-containing protein n=1 Tax=Candidatus Roizmanbacteria bacterium RIFCSPHIGHO2_01_FULL_39_24 TaxID=1802032 RepID=A0A1F7GKT7_9BACT|nr:MAG: hypothetical protein A2799_01415 [Candidatus Roizmanbacteria bacterium RIFCSPHIGHO2_01_FULL_39_24]OGK26909.1 MAG: hypothetical protein A3D80_02055 [Candidatus Roizmanbacteria bacterium RIFCSPHIGHO2_02_FULL_40_13b]OGK49457.1 MAG: hypothetical protein A3A56_03580 [Candidatus Roizmanbacteria bacterium RIFCSPLOWO2_01_FULL_40_32]